MSEIVANAPTLPSGPPPRFDTLPYKPDGGFTSGNSALLLGIFLVAGTVLGIIAHFVSKAIWLVMVFPVLIGLILGGIGIAVVKKYKIRNPWLAGIAGFLGGCLAILAMRYSQYLEFRSTAPPEMIQFVEMPAEVQAQIRPLLPPEAQLELKMYDSFFGYMDGAAEHGVEIKSTRGGGKGSNLGYAGSWIYWGLEVLIIAGFAFAMVRGKASEPFCVECETWKNRSGFASLPATGDSVDAAVRDGEPWRVLKDGSAPPEFEAADIFVDVCPNCNEKAPFEMQVMRRRWNKKGEGKGVKTYARVTYPGEALPVVIAQFQPPQQPVVAEAVEEQPTEPKPEATE